MFFALLVMPCGLFAQVIATQLPNDLPPVQPSDGTAYSAPQLYGINGGGSVELGQKVILSVYFNGDGAGQTYAWRKGATTLPGATAKDFVIDAAVADDAGTYSVTVTNSSGSSVASTEVTVKAAAPPVITSQPPSQVCYVGQPVVFGFGATGSYPRTHQWKKNGADIPGATEATYRIATVTTADAGSYSVVVTNSLGSAATSSASLTVNAAVPVVLYPSSPTDATAVQGGSVSFYAGINSGSEPFTFQWRKNGVPIPGATDGSLSLPVVALTDAGKYSVVVTNPAGSATSREATLIVTPAIPVAITRAPESAAIYEGQDASFSVSVNGSSPVTFRWLKNGSPISEATHAYYFISSAQLSDEGSYSVVVTNAAGSVTSPAATLVVHRAVLPAITRQPAGQTVAYGGDVSLSVESSGSPPLTYAWKKDGVPLGYTGSSYYLSNATPANSGVYMVTVTNAAGSVTSHGATITVQPAVAPSITRQPLGQTVAYGSSVRLFIEAAGSPTLAYQWKKDGVPVGSSSYYGSEYGISNATPAHSGSYTVTVTNSAGSITSQSATLTVQPAIAPTITRQPQSQTVAYGRSFELAVDVSGSPALTYQWMKDGVALGFSGSRYYVGGANATHSGTYTVKITNVAGSVTSENAVVTVEAAIAPRITTPPQSLTLNYKSSISLSVKASGSSPLSYQWRKDGVPLVSGGTSESLYIWDATPANSGSYTVVVSNVAGSVTSAAAIVTVKPAAAPVLTSQPKSLEVAQGLRASFSVSVDATGTGGVSYQWRRNGIAIANATYSSFEIAAVKPADAGDYTLVATGLGGSVTSQAAKLTVLPPAPPRISYYSGYSGEATTSLGSYTSLSFSIVEGSPPFTYQWSKNGVPIPGATNASLNFNRVTVDDLAVYVLTVSNEAGVAASLPVRLMISPYAEAVATPWLDAGRVGDVVYFLATVPSRIERFDLAAERWLPTVLLSDTLVPTAFVPTAEGIYVAYGRTLVRRSLDLATETPLINTTVENNLLFVAGNFLYYDGGGSSSYNRVYGTVHRATLAAGPAVSPSTLYGNQYKQVAIAASLGKGFARSTGSTPSDIVMFKLAADGSVTESIDSPYHSNFPPANRTFLLPGDTRVADDSGTIYSTTDLSFAGSFGSRLTDLAFLADGSPVILREQTLTLAAPGSTLETSRVALPQEAVRLFTRGSTVFAFGTPALAGGTYRVSKVDKNAFGPIPGGKDSEAPVARYSVDDAFLGGDNVVHVLSRSLPGLVRWSADTRSLLTTLGLRGVPFRASHQPGQSRVLFSYLDGVITAVPLRAAPAVENPLGVLNLRVRAMVDIGDHVVLNVASSQSSGDMRTVLGPNGFMGTAWESLYYGNVLAWVDSSRRLYSVAPHNSDSLLYEIVPESGVLPTSGAKTAASLTPPLRFNPENTLAATGNGRVVNADLEQVGVLANDIVDATWLTDGLYTLRSARGGTEIQQWTRSTYLLKNSLSLSGVPVRIFRLSDAQMAVVTADRGMAAFTVVNADLSVSTSPVSTIQVSAQPRSQVVVPDGSASFSTAQHGGSGTVSYQWLRNGTTVPGASSSSYTVANVAPASAGLYSACISDGTAATFTEPAILGVSTTQKVLGSGSELAGDILHPNGRSYDQILPSGAAVSVTADFDQVTRTSFIDMNDDIVQVEFSGAGTLSIVLSGASAPAAPANYNQPTVRYVKGHAAIVISGADETTNVSVFSIGRATAFDPTGAFNILQPINAANDPARNGSTLFQGHQATAYDGVADLAYIAILSNNGKFGGVRAANANFFASTGVTGIYAPGVQFTGPVYLGSLDAFGDANPALVLGSANDIRVTGGDLQQTNSRAIKVAGVSQVKFVDGMTSHGVALPAQQNRARFDQNGVDVTAQIVVNPVRE